MLPLLLTGVMACHATVIFSDDFRIRMLDPNYTAVSNNNSINVGRGILSISDMNANSVFVDLTADKFVSTTVASGGVFTISYDISVSSWQGSGLSGPRFCIFNNGNFDYIAPDDVFAIGFGTGIDTMPVTGVTPVGFFHAGNSSLAGTRITNGGADFNFGAYSATPSQNGTSSGAGNAFYRVSFQLTQGSNLVTNGSITRLDSSGTAVGEPATFSSSIGTTPLDWSGGSENDGFRIMTGAQGLSSIAIDSITITYVPEPASGCLVVMGMLCLLSRRRSPERQDVS